MHPIIYGKKRKAPSKSVRLLDKLMSILAFITPLLVVPQIIQLIISKDASNLSIIMWLAWFIVSIPWLIYALIHKIKPLAIMYILWLLVHGTMTVLILIY